jgi:hypothetical protein
MDFDWNLLKTSENLKQCIQEALQLVICGDIQSAKL